MINVRLLQVDHSEVIKRILSDGLFGFFFNIPAPLTENR